MDILTAIVGVIIMGLGAVTVLGMVFAAAISIVTVSKEKKQLKKAAEKDS